MTYSHDPNGNVSGTSAGQTFTYDPFNRMIQAVSSGGTATYTYNGDGLKIQRVGPDGATRYYHDGIRPIWETDGAGAVTAQLDRDIFGNLLSRREASGTRRYYHPDGLGSTVALSDEAGGVAASMLYDAWGNVRVNTGVGHGRYRFAGAELDEASGLYHMGARFYDPTLGRWLSEDPIQDKLFDPSALNAYAYALGNPISYVDPDGKVAVLPVLIVGLAIVEVGLTAFDIFNAVQTLTSNASIQEKTAVLLLAAVGAITIGGGYTPAAKFVGRSFRLGRVVRNPGITLERFSKHSLNRIIERRLSPATILDTLRNPAVILEQRGGRYLYVSKEAAVVMAKDGEVVTAWGAKEFTQEIIDILETVGATQ